MKHRDMLFSVFSVVCFFPFIINLFLCALCVVSCFILVFHTAFDITIHHEEHEGHEDFINII